MSWTDVHRAVLDSAGELLEATDYYASGLPVSSTVMATGVTATDRRHIGNRWLPEGGLYMHDNIARFHDPILLCFTTIDRLSSTTPQFSPYSHCAGNPMRYIDPTGNEIYDPDNHCKNIEQRTKYKEDTKIHIFAHGTKKGNLIIEGKSMNAHDVSEFIKKQFNLSKDSKVDIVLHSCMAAAKDISTAKEISEEFPNGTVTGPNGIVVEYSTGREEVFDDPNLKIKDLKGKKPVDPQWKTYKNGEINDKKEEKTTAN